MDDCFALTISTVTNCSFHNSASFVNSLDTDFELIDIIESVEDPASQLEGHPHSQFYLPEDINTAAESQ